MPSVEWHNDTSLWATAINSQLDNIWYFASRTSPIYHARRLNATGALPFVLPSLTEKDVIYYPRVGSLYTNQSRDWASAFLRVTTGLQHPHVEHGNSDWGRSITPKSVKCFKNVAITGAFGHVVRGHCGSNCCGSGVCVCVCVCVCGCVGVCGCVCCVRRVPVSGHEPARACVLTVLTVYAVLRLCLDCLYAVLVT